MGMFDVKPPPPQYVCKTCYEAGLITFMEWVGSTMMWACPACGHQVTKEVLVDFGPHYSLEALGVLDYAKLPEAKPKPQNTLEKLIDSAGNYKKTNSSMVVPALPRFCDNPLCRHHRSTEHYFAVAGSNPNRYGYETMTGQVRYVDRRGLEVGGLYGFLCEQCWCAQDPHCWRDKIGSQDAVCANTLCGWHRPIEPGKLYPEIEGIYLPNFDKAYPFCLRCANVLKMAGYSKVGGLDEKPKQPKKMHYPGGIVYGLIDQFTNSNKDKKA